MKDHIASLPYEVFQLTLVINTFKRDGPSSIKILKDQFPFLFFLLELS